MEKDEFRQFLDEALWDRRMGQVIMDWKVYRGGDENVVDGSLVAPTEKPPLPEGRARV